jgi:hypothetical protein
MGTRVKQIALKDLDNTVKAAIEAVNVARSLKVKGPIINGIIIKPELLKALKPEAVAKEITSQVALAVKDVRLQPTVSIGDKLITMGYIIRDPIGPVIR